MTLIENGAFGSDYRQKFPSKITILHSPVSNKTTQIFDLNHLIADRLRLENSECSLFERLSYPCNKSPKFRILVERENLWLSL